MSAVHSKYHPSPDAGREDERRDRSNLQGGWLALARVFWLFSFFYVLAIFIFQLPVAFDQLRNPAYVGQIGISLDLYAWIIIILAVLTMTVSMCVAAILFWRRSHDWMALVASLFLILFSGLPLGAALVGPPLPDVFPMPGWLHVLVNIPGAAVLYAFFLLFPSGRFVPHWCWALIPLWVCQTTLFDLTTFALTSELPDWAALGYPILFIAAIAFQIYHYRRISTPVERQQTKWVATALIAFLLVSQASTWIADLTPLRYTLFAPISQAIYMVAGLVVPIAYLIAMQRYRLYEIDRLINKALVYGLLTGILGATFVGVVIGLQMIARTTTGQDSPVALVATTLLIAGLVQPLRRRIQKVIDQRFYRAKYDAQKTLASFSAALR